MLDQGLTRDQGIRYVRSLINKEGSKGKWDQFWRYFRKTWMGRFDSSLWNVNSMMVGGIDITNRTNNPFEKYNRDFGEKFGRGAHPSLLAFMEIAKAEALGYMNRIQDIKLVIQTAPRHAEAVITQVPDDYTNLM
ncbi:hypothetical protein F444_20374 [Phytophthora nicotianae P1976]|uniref:Uncharacterized protein n=1 Tax=Phytophthora nicotianae P1976 TaxID=1317066 RepID=A0A080Z4T4_PHYNI|nr:hypothetical protein F444_20374 [Phytophthora nicotianae P1976]